MNPIETYSFNDALSIALGLVVLFSAVIAVLYCIWGGLLLIMSGGNEEKIKPAVNHIRHAVIGLVAIMVMIFIIPKVLNYFQLPFASELEANHIFQTLGQLADRVFGGSIASPGVLPSSNDSVIGDDFSNL